MAALVRSIQVASNWLGRPLKKTTCIIERTYIIAKILFMGKSKYKKSQGITNLFLASREACFSAPSGNDFPLKTHWAALCAARENFKKNEKSLILEHIYNSARTYFIKNS